MRTSFFHCASLLTSTALLVSSSLAAEPADSLREKAREALQDSLRISKDNRAAVVHRLVDVYDELSHTQELDVGDRNRLQAQVRARLDRLAGILTRQIATDAAAVPANDAKQAAEPKQPRSIKPQDNEILAQRFVAPGRAARPGAFPAGGFQQARGFGVQPGLGLGGNPLGPAQPPDNGQALVDLIQRTIEPASWDIVGGPGSIVYFRPRQVLVVRQRSEVHEQLQDVVRQLRP